MGGVASYEAFWGSTGKGNRKLLAEQHEGFKAAARRADNPAPEVMDVESREVEGAAQ
jgi:hypothetical protein